MPVVVLIIKVVMIMWQLVVMQVIVLVVDMQMSLSEIKQVVPFTGGTSDVFMGDGAGQCSCGSYNIYIKYETGQGTSSVSNNTGCYNIAFGIWAGRNITNGMSNILLGYNSGCCISSGCCNIFWEEILVLQILVVVIILHLELRYAFHPYW